jgi:hypothetical protein
MRATGLAVALVGIAVAGCSHRAPTASEPDASTIPSDASVAPGEVFGLLGRSLGHAPLIFHPTRALVAQIQSSRCHVWDLEIRAYRGSVDAQVCKAWSRVEPAPAAPAGIASGTPHAPTSASDALLFTRSTVGPRALSGRRGLARVSLWSGPDLGSVRELTIEEPRHELEIVSLRFTAKGDPMALTRGNGPVLWLGDTLTARQPANEGHVNVDEVSADPQGRYAGYSGTMDWGRTFFPVTAVVRTSDGEEVLKNTATEPRSPRILWADRENAALALDSRPLPVEPGDDVSVTATLTSLAGGPVATSGFERGILRRADIAPHGGAAVLAFDAYSEPPPDGPDGRSARPSWYVFGPAFSHRMSGISRATAWAGDDATLGVALDAEVVSVFSITPGATPPLVVRATWKGRAPLALAPDGRRAVFVQKGGLVFGDVMSKAVSHAAAILPLVITWGARAIAAATPDEVFVLDARTGAVTQKLTMPGVTAIVWDPPGARFAAISSGEALLVEDDASAPSRVPIAPDAQVSFTAEGDLVLREKRGIQRFARRDGAWVPGPMREGVDGALASRDGLFLAEGGAFRRLADDEVLHRETQGSFTDSGAYDRAPPPGAAFREGDVIAGHLLPPSEIVPEVTLDLVSRFASGAAIPHPKKRR